MNRWDFEWRRAVKQPPPEHGIKVKKAGTTWWGERWIGALEAVLRGDAGRLARGRSYARAGRAHDLVVEHGHVTAQVTGSRPTPYEVRIELAALDEAAWAKALAAMAEKAHFAAELLAGGMPPDIDEAFRAAGASLFPSKRADLVTSCSCPDTGDPCKHVAATHYVLGEALDRDPFLLFELRGKSRNEVLDALRRARGTAPSGRARTKKKRTGPAATSDTDAHAAPKVRLERVKASDYDRAREKLPALHFSFEEPALHGAMLRQLGAPAAWRSEQSLDAALTPLLRTAAETARRLALSEPPAAATAPATERAAERPYSSQAPRKPSKRASRDR